VGPSCAAFLLAARLASAEDAAAPAPAPIEPTATVDPPSPTRLALRDPFAATGPAVRYRTPTSPDLIDPFTRPPSAAPSRSRDLRDPFESGVMRRCLPHLRGVPVQRPRQLPQTTAPCVIDAPLRNPFEPRGTTTRTS
jgi:hypothetical protein